MTVTAPADLDAAWRDRRSVGLPSRSRLRALVRGRVTRYDLASPVSEAASGTAGS